MSFDAGRSLDAWWKAGNLKRFLIVLAFLATIAVSHRIGQEQMRDAAQAEVKKANQERKEESARKMDIINAQGELLKDEENAKQDGFAGGVLMMQECSVNHNEAACQYVRQQVADWRERRKNIASGATDTR